MLCIFIASVLKLIAILSCFIQSSPISGVIFAFVISSGSFIAVVFVFIVALVCPTNSILLSLTSL